LPLLSSRASQRHSQNIDGSVVMILQHHITLPPSKTSALVQFENQRFVSGHRFSDADVPEMQTA
jgi:hypothetical protein